LLILFFLFFKNRDVFRLKKGIKGDYKAGYSVFIISYKESEENQKRFNDVKKSFKESPRYKGFRSIAERIFQGLISFSLPRFAENNTNIISNFGHKVVNSPDFVYIGQSENLIIFNHMVNSDERGR